MWPTFRFEGRSTWLQDRCWKDHPLRCNKYAGALMGYSALGTPSDGWKDKLRPLFLAKSTKVWRRLEGQATA